MLGTILITVVLTAALTVVAVGLFLWVMIYVLAQRALGNW